MLRFLALFLGVCCVLLTFIGCEPSARAGFFGPSHYGTGFVGDNKSVPKLVRQASDYGPVLAEFETDDYTVSSGRVTTATDGSGNGQTVTNATAGNAPLYVANAINGKPAMDLGSGLLGEQRKLTKSNSNIFQNRAAVTMVGAINIENCGKYHEIWQASVNGGSGDRVRYQLADGTCRLFVKERRLDSDSLVQTFSGSNAYTANADHFIYNTWGNTNGLMNGWMDTTQVYTDVSFTGGGNSENLTSDTFAIGDSYLGTGGIGHVYLGNLYFIEGLPDYGDRIGLENLIHHEYGTGTPATLDSVTSLIARRESRPSSDFQSEDTVARNSLSQLISQVANGGDWEQPTKTIQPGKASNGFGAEFDGSAYKMTMTADGLDNTNGVSEFCSTIVFEPDTTHQGWLKFISTGTSSTNYRFAIRVNSNNTVSLYHRRDDAGSGFSRTSTNTYNVGSRNIVTGCVDYGTNFATLELNEVMSSGAAGVSSSTFSATDSLLTILGSSGSADWFDGVIYADLEFTERDHATDVGNYLRWELF